CHCERPLGRVAINRQGIPTRWIASLTLAMTQVSVIASNQPYAKLESCGFYAVRLPRVSSQ
ncbi:MAG: hypothetical protein K2H55_05210, partial [Helicobacter sp.]|nr:hypothetical protein [Helicobacter sp.]